MSEPTRDQLARDYAKALAIIDGLRGERDAMQARAESAEGDRQDALAKRDALLAALKTFLEVDTPTEDEDRAAREAVAKAEGRERS